MVCCSCTFLSFNFLKFRKWLYYFEKQKQVLDKKIVRLRESLFCTKESYTISRRGLNLILEKLISKPFEN